MKAISTATMLAMVLVFSGCVSMSSAEREGWRAMEAEGARSSQGPKNPALAGGLNLLPGIGNFYLATNTDESGQIWVGVANLLLWPMSPIWGVPQAVVDANTINKKHAVQYGDARQR